MTSIVKLGVGWGGWLVLVGKSDFNESPVVQLGLGLRLRVCQLKNSKNLKNSEKLEKNLKILKNYYTNIFL